MKPHVVWFTLALTALVIQFTLATRPPQASADAGQPFALVKDSNVDPHSVSSLGGATVFSTINNRMLFSAFTPQTGDELWSTDGTPDGTQLVKDILPGEQGAFNINNKGSFVLNKLLLFTPDDGVHGSELWASDGTPGGTRLLKDLFPGAEDSNPSDFIVAGKRAFFVAQISATQQALWRTDGTPNGTTMVHAFAYFGGSVMVTGNTLFFDAAEKDLDDELWQTDLTVGTTSLVRDLVPGPQGSFPRLLFPYSSREIWFSARTGQNNNAVLWRSDGSPNGTRRFTQLSSSLEVTPPLLNTSKIVMLPRSVQSNLPDRFVFDADDGTHGKELWVTDGTPASTTLLKDANLNGDSGPTLLGTMANPTGIGRAFYAMNDGTNGAEPWVTDGTADGTMMLANIYPRNGSNPGPMVAVSNLNFFAATSAEGGRELWKTDGTLPGTVQVADIASGPTGSDPQDLMVFNNALYFTANDDVHGRELWRTDGTTTTMLRDILLGDAGGAWRIMGVTQNALLFAADDGTTGVELWKTDGTSQGTTQVKNIAPDTGGIFLDKGENAGAFGDKLVFGVNLDSNGEALRAGVLTHADTRVRATRTTRSQQMASSAALWLSDGTAGGTFPFKPLGDNNSFGPIQNLTALGNGMLFTSHTDDDTTELWRTDGTAAGTGVLANIVKPSVGYVDGLTRLNNLVLFDVYTSTLQNQPTYTSLWKSDGTAGGTQLIAKDVAVDRDNQAVSGNTLFFASASNDTNTPVLWVSDGTPTGTHGIPMLAKENAVLSPRYITAGQPGQVFFLAYTGSGGGQLWKSDGTSNGTVLVHNGLVAAQQFVYSGTTLFFTNYDQTHGRELWKSDGTDAGTTLVSDIYPGSGSSQPEQLTSFNGTLYFTATGSDGKRTLWRSDGTSGGTQPIRDDASAPLNPTELTVAQNQLLFSAADDAHGREVWHSDGTAAGTVLLQDIVPGAASSNPETFIAAGKQLYFTADTPETGRELWALTPAASSQATPTLQPGQPTSTLQPGQATPTLQPGQPTPTLQPGQASANQLYLPVVLR